MHVTQQQLAEVFSVTTRTIQRWGPEGLDEARVPGEATYDLTRAVAWRLEAVQATTDDEYRQARGKRMAADAELKEIELAKARGSLIAIEDVEVLLRGSLEKVNLALRAAPSRLANKLVEMTGRSRKECQKIISEIVEGARVDLRSIGRAP